MGGQIPEISNLVAIVGLAHPSPLSLIGFIFNFYPSGVECECINTSSGRPVSSEGGLAFCLGPSSS